MNEGPRDHHRRCKDEEEPGIQLRDELPTCSAGYDTLPDRLHVVIMVQVVHVLAVG